ncbi:MAG: hypothetical protein AB7F36_00605 [Reyranellaceae bacterium]
MPVPAYPLSNALSKAVRALRRGRLHRLVGRLRAFGALVALWRGLLDRAAKPPSPGVGDCATLFPGLSPPAAVQALRVDGLWLALRLPAAIVTEIADYARCTPCHLPRDDRESFLVGEVRNGRTPDGRPAPIAEVDLRHPCPAIAAIAADPRLREIARRYLGFSPRRIERRLYWSPVADLPDHDRRAGGQTVDFHFDVEVSRALYVFFYIVGGDRQSGCHVAVAGSHRRKPLRLALAPAFQTDAAVFACFDRTRETIVEGGAGFGFLEDPACYHKVLPPKHGPRLLLQLRMF